MAGIGPPRAGGATFYRRAGRGSAVGRAVGDFDLDRLSDVLEGRFEVAHFNSLWNVGLLLCGLVRLTCGLALLIFSVRRFALSSSGVNILVSDNGGAVESVGLEAPSSGGSGNPSEVASSFSFFFGMLFSTTGPPGR